MARLSPFKQIDVTRAARAAHAAGLQVARVEIDPDGKISVITTATLPAPAPASAFDEWKAGKNAHST